MSSKASGDQSALDIRLFGGLEIRRHGEAVLLPHSKKTRALLGYLILKGTPQRRDALCELLWEIPDDPRAALRWSLSKLRPLVNDENAERLSADRERITFDRSGASVDILRAEDACATGLQKHSRQSLLDICNACNGLLLAGLDLPAQPVYESWRLGQQDRARRLQLSILDELISRDDCAAAERTQLMRRRIELAPDNEDAHLTLIAHLASSGHRAEAEGQAEISRRMLGSIGAVDEAHIAMALKGSAKKSSPPAHAPRLDAEVTAPRQSIRFCTASDGVRIAYATVGSGPPLVKTANWLNHLEFDWESPVWRHMFRALSQNNTFIRYDARGNGLSDWTVEDLSLDALVKDLKAVVDDAGVDRFPLLGISQGCAVAIEFAARHPERVSKLIFLGGYAHGWRLYAESEGAKAHGRQRDALVTLVKTGWGSGNPAFRQTYTSLFFPKASQEQMDWFNELQRITTSATIASRIMDSHGNLDVTHRLKDIKVPTLVIHARNDALVPYVAGRRLAMDIPGARFVTLESDNHLILEQDPAWPRFLAEVRAFLAE
jgi:pimeloyl-ACP methyl ester carboxylesterase/DNA-binding SARP family transcriptional activator